MLLAYFFFWAGILVTIGLVLFNIVDKFIVPRIKRKVDKLSKFMISTHVANQSSEYTTKEALLAHFIQNEGKTKYKQLTLNGHVSASIFTDLVAKFFNVEILSEVCAWNKEQCIHSMKLVGKGGNSFYLTFNTHTLLWKNNVRNLYKKVNEEDGFKVSIDENSRFEVIRNLTIIFSTNVQDSNSDLQDLYSVLNIAEVEPVHIPVPMHKRTTVYRFAFNANIGYYLQDTEQEIKLHNEEIVNASYNDMQIDYEGHKQLVTPSQAMEIARVALLNKRNAFVFGKMGCGKTTFARQVLARLEDEPNVRLISIPPAMIGQLQNPQAQAALVDLLSSKIEIERFNYELGESEIVQEQILNIILIDEAETLLQKSENGVHTEAQAFLLSMMDGEIRDVLNCQVLFVFNKSKEHLNPVIFRSMRGGLEFHVEPIPMERAKKLVELLKLENVHLRFDAKKFHEFITDISLASDGVMYAPAGFTTLADVVSCFTPPELDDAIIAALRGMKIPKVEKKEPKKIAFKVPGSKEDTQVPTVKMTLPAKQAAPNEPAPPIAVSTGVSMSKGKKNRWRKRK